MILSGKVWRFGDHIDTDQVLPGQYINLPDKTLRASHCFENIYPGFVSLVKPGDLIVAGLNFGCGSSRPSVEILQDLGIGGVIAKSFARIFFRGGIARGFPLAICPSLRSEDLPTGREVILDLERGNVVDQNNGETFSIEAFPKFFREIIEAKGLINYTRNFIARECDK